LIFVESLRELAREFFVENFVSYLERKKKWTFDLRIIIGFFPRFSRETTEARTSFTHIAKKYSVDELSGLRNKFELSA